MVEQTLVQLASPRILLNLDGYSEYHFNPSCFYCILLEISSAQEHFITTCQMHCELLERFCLFKQRSSCTVYIHSIECLGRVLYLPQYFSRTLKLWILMRIIHTYSFTISYQKLSF